MNSDLRAFTPTIVDGIIEERKCKIVVPALWEEQYAKAKVVFKEVTETADSDKEIKADKAKMKGKTTKANDQTE